MLLHCIFQSPVLLTIMAMVPYSKSSPLLFTSCQDCFVSFSYTMDFFFQNNLKDLILSYKMNIKQSQRSISILEDGSKSSRLYYTEKINSVYSLHKMLAGDSWELKQKKTH